MIALSDSQLKAVMTALAPLEPDKRTVALERIAAQLQRGPRRLADQDITQAIAVALRGLLQGAA